MNETTFFVSAACFSTIKPFSSSPLPDMVMPFSAVNGSKPMISIMASIRSSPSSSRACLIIVEPSLEVRIASKSKCTTNFESLATFALSTLAACPGVESSASPIIMNTVFFILKLSRRRDDSLLRYTHLFPVRLRGFSKIYSRTT